MRASLHDLWGCGRGPVRQAAPQTRLGAGVMLFSACMVSTGATLAGSLCAAAVSTAWVLLCRPPWWLLRASFLLGLALLLPYFLLLPLLPDAPSTTAESWRRSLAVPWTILLRGLCGMLVCTATASSLSATDLREALLRLPVPRIVSAILLQIVQQTATLFHETRRVAAAMAVRGASSGGVAARRIIFSLPRVWLPRVIDRAERIAAAMELRGYCDGRQQLFRTTSFSFGDLGTLAAAGVALTIAIAVRVSGAP